MSMITGYLTDLRKDLSYDTAVYNIFKAKCDVEASKAIILYLTTIALGQSSKADEALASFALIKGYDTDECVKEEGKQRRRREKIKEDLNLNGDPANFGKREDKLYAKIEFFYDDHLKNDHEKQEFIKHALESEYYDSDKKIAILPQLFSVPQRPTPLEEDPEDTTDSPPSPSTPQDIPPDSPSPNPPVDNPLPPPEPPTTINPNIMDDPIYSESLNVFYRKLSHRRKFYSRYSAIDPNVAAKKLKTEMFVFPKIRAAVVAFIILLLLLALAEQTRTVATYNPAARGRNVELQERYAENKTWLHTLDNARIDDVVEYQFIYINDSGFLGWVADKVADILNLSLTANNVKMRLELDPNLEFIEGSTILYNSSHQEGFNIIDDSVIRDGIIVGNYAFQGNAFIRIKCRITDSNLKPGSNILTTKAIATINEKDYSDQVSISLTY